MTYPTVEKKVQEEKDRAELRTKEGELYIDSGSFEEFELKRTIAGIKHCFVDDIFKMHYFYNDKCKWLYDNEGLKVMITLVTITTSLATILSIVISSAAFLLMFSIPATIVAMSCTIAYFWTCAGYSIADGIIASINSERKENESKALYKTLFTGNNNKLSAGISGYYQSCSKSYNKSYNSKSYNYNNINSIISDISSLSC